MYLFFGSDLFAQSVLEGLCEEALPIAVVTQPDRASGRKQKIKPGPLASFAKERNLSLFQPETLKGAEHQDTLMSYKAKLFIVVSFGQILPQSLLDRSPPIINGHASLLPKYRGASPIQSSLLAGDKETGMTIMHIVKALDAGPMICEEKIAIMDEDNHQSLSEKLAESCISLLMPFAKGEEVPAGIEQNHDVATFCGKIKKEDLFIFPEKQNCVTVHNMVRAYGPKPGATLFIKHNQAKMRLKLIQTKRSEEKLAPKEFKLKEKKLFLGCQSGSLELLKVQPEGKGVMEVRDFLNGWKEPLEIASL